MPTTWRVIESGKLKSIEGETVSDVFRPLITDQRITMFEMFLSPADRKLHTIFVSK